MYQHAYKKKEKLVYDKQSLLFNSDMPTSTIAQQPNIMKVMSTQE
jgi:hypothetical protein